MAHATCLTQDRDVFIVKSGALSESGDPVNIEWKLWQYKDGAVCWELRNVLSTYYEGVTEKLVHAQGCQNNHLPLVGARARKHWQEVLGRGSAVDEGVQCEVQGRGHVQRLHTGRVEHLDRGLVGVVERVALRPQDSARPPAVLGNA